MAKSKTKIRGITIELEGNATKLNDALSSSEKKSKELSGELKTINTLLKFDPSNAEALTQKQKVLTEAIEETSKQLEVMKNAQQQIQEQADRGDIGQDQLREFQRELQFAENRLKMYQGNLEETNHALASLGTETVSASSDLEKLEDTIKDQESTLDTLKDRYASVVLAQGKSSDEAKALKKEIQTLDKELAENKTTLDEVRGSADKLTPSLDSLGDKAKDSGDGFTVMKGAMSNLVSGAISGAVSAVGDLAGSLMELSEATEEYRLLQAKLEGATLNNGYAIDFTKEKYKEMYSYLGDDQMATNAVTNLLGLQVSTDTLNDLLDGATGVWASYGDSIPIESLTEATNETIQVGKVTGTFADTINWAKISNEQMAKSFGTNNKAIKAFNKALKDGETQEDAFNAGLAEITETQERAEVVARFLNDTYGESKEKFDEMTGGITDANRAEIELKETQAELGETLEPVNTKITELKDEGLKLLIPIVEESAEAFLNLMEFLEKQPEVIETVITVLAGLTAGFVSFKIAVSIVPLINTLKTALTGLFAVMSANPIGLILGLVGGLTTAFLVHKNATDENTKAQNELTESIKKEADGWKELKQAQEEQLNAGLSEIEHIKNLKSELDTLIDKNGKIKEGYENRANFIVGELRDATGAEIEIVDGVIKKYDELSGSIDTLIEKKRFQIIMESQEEAYKEALTTRMDTLNQMNQLEQEIADARAKRAEDAIIAEEGRTLLERDQAEARMEILDKEIAQKEEAYSELKNLVKDKEDTIAQYEYNSLVYSSGNLEEMRRINSQYGMSYSDRSGDVIEALQTQIANEQIALKAQEEMYRDTGEQMYLDQMTATQKRIDELNKSLDAQTSIVKTKTPQFESAHSIMINKGLNAFLKPSPQFKTGAETQVNNATSGVTGKAQANIGAWADMTAKSWDEFTAHNHEYYPTGEQTVQGVIDGVNNKQGSIWEKMWSVGQGMLSNLKESLGIKSPSRKMKEQVGLPTVQGVEVGIEENRDLALNASRRLGNDIINTVDGLKLERAMASSVSMEGSSSSMVMSNASLSQRIDGVYAILSQYLPEMVEKLDRPIALDDGTLVSRLAPDLDVAFADIAEIKQRGGG